jgi:cell division protein ZapA
MGDLSIKIKIGDREYPMKVKPEEEERVRLAGRQLNEKLKTFRDHFKIDDKQDLLSMIAFDAQAGLLKSEHGKVDLLKKIDSKIAELDDLLTRALKR